MIRAIVYWRRYWGPVILGTYHIGDYYRVVKGIPGAWVTV